MAKSIIHSKKRHATWGHARVILVLAVLFGLMVPPRPASANVGVVAAYCVPLIATNGCLAQAFGCPAPPIPCPVFDGSALIKFLQQIAIQIGANAAWQMIEDLTNDQRDAIGSFLIGQYSYAFDVSNPPITLPHQVSPDDPAVAAIAGSEVDPEKKNACDLCLSYVSPKYPTGSTQERQQITANRQDAMQRCDTELFIRTMIAEATLKSYGKSCPSATELSKILCGKKNVGTEKCNTIVLAELEKQGGQIERIWQPVETVKSLCDTLRGFDDINYREGGVQMLCAEYCKPGG